jgi:DNA polymerase-1
MMSKRILLVDLSNLAFRFILEPDLKRIPERIASTVLSFMNSYRCDNVYVCMDKSKSKWRRERLPSYKSQRMEKFTDEEKQKRQEFYKAVGKALPFLETIGLDTFAYDDIEADDILAYLVDYIRDKDPDAEIFLLSSDTDLLQLNVKQYSIFKQDWVTLESQGFTSIPQYVHCKAIAGDTSDNIIGVKGIGLKTAKKIMDKYEVETIDELLLKLPASPKLKREKAIMDNAELICRNVELIDLYRNLGEIVPEKIRADIREKVDKSWENTHKLVCL